MSLQGNARLRAKLAQAASPPAPSSVPGPSRRAVSGFPAHTDLVQGLPLDDRILLRLLAEWVVETHEPGNFPAVKITCIGHADRDFQRGRAYEHDISARRARAVLQSLEADIRLLGGIQIITGLPPVIAKIKLESSGVGATEAAPAQNEKQRLRNRRVEIVFERGPPVQPPQPFLDILDVTRRVIRGMWWNIPVPRPRFLDDIKPLPTKDEWREFIKFLKASPLRFVDMKTVVESVIDVIGPPANEEERREKWAEDMLDALKEDEAERRKRTLDPPGEPDDPD